GSVAGDPEAEVVVGISFGPVDLREQLLGPFDLFQPAFPGGVTRLLVLELLHRRVAVRLPHTGLPVIISARPTPIADTYRIPAPDGDGGSICPPSGRFRATFRRPDADTSLSISLYVRRTCKDQDFHRTRPSRSFRGLWGGLVVRISFCGTVSPRFILQQV